MDYTTNYHLPQWVESDRIMMEDFNEAMAAIDGGIKAAQNTADGSAAAAENAQATADRAEGKADAARTVADTITSKAYTPDNKPFVIGTYTGNGDTQTIDLGFRPTALIVGYGGIIMTNFNSLITCGSVKPYEGALDFTDNGFTVTAAGDGRTIQLNGSGYVYDYIALR